MIWPFGRRRVVLVFGGSLSVLLLVFLGLWLYATQSFLSVGPNKTSTKVEIEPGRGAWDIANLLGSRGIIDSPNIFMFGVWRTGNIRTLKAGEYLFPPELSSEQVMDLLVTGEVFKYRITVPEGLRSQQIIQILKEAEPLRGQLSTIPAEGSLLPETYLYKRGDRRTDLVKRMKIAMDKELMILWHNRDSKLPLKTPQEALILASIVEKETSLSSERRKVAGVFINRLRKNMRLQSDPTILYAITDGMSQMKTTLSRKDLKYDSPFNTYLYRGLPPSPIAHPGKEALAAVLNPLITEALYFVADGTGGHAFAETLSQHQRNVRRWRRHQAKKIK